MGFLGDTPVAGFYRAKLVSDGPYVALRIWFGAPIIGGTEQDRSPRWNIEVDGETTFIERDADTGYRCSVLYDVYRFWPHCGRSKICENEYRYMKDFAAYAKAHAQHLPEASPRSPINLVGGKSLRP